MIRLGVARERFARQIDARTTVIVKLGHYRSGVRGQEPDRDKRSGAGERRNAQPGTVYGLPLMADG